ncbi:hypothetical protein [Hymenobacter negativus]|uniref:Uncharacterized protein n=1 Tax=Hymenobacter negativus TaxID=2795026 RepID=A0ABS3QJU4_9BACT|nr:hypothetical protein [Hymenobacter negativus]MBO2011519.1 hypothetical protein [Hymenobacter negativus]
MQTATPIKRHYTIADATMRQDMRTMHEHYASHAAAFQAFNPEFDAAFGTDWLAAIDAADAEPDHTVRTGELMEDTAEVTDVMDRARAGVQTLFYYVGRAFPHNAGRMATYGRSSYEAARKQHDQMRSLLQTAFTSATRDHAALAAKGYTAAQLAALGTLVTELADTNTTQEVTKGTNTEGRDHYVTVQNLAYGYGQEVSAAAKVLFAADAATLKLFRLSGPAPAAHETHELTVAPEDTGSVLLSTPLLATTKLHLRLAVPAPHQEAVVGRAVAPGSKIFTFVTLTQEVSELDVTAAALGASGQYVLVQNGSPAAVHVEITVLG